MKKLKKEQFPDIAESPRTLKKKLMDKHPQKYADQSNDKILSYYEKKTDHENRNGSAKEIISQSNFIVSNDDLNSSLKKENSNDSLSPIKIDEKEISRRMNSDKRDSIRKPNSIRAVTQYRKASNDPNNIELLNENQNLNKKTLQQKCRKDSQETYQPNLDNIRLSNNDWNGDIQQAADSTIIYSPNKIASNLDQSDYNHFELLANNTANTSLLNQTQNLKICDYLKIIDSKSVDNNTTSSKNQNNGVNINSLSAVAKIFSDDYKMDQNSELDFDEHFIIEEVTKDELTDKFDKMNSSHFIK